MSVELALLCAKIPRPLAVEIEVVTSRCVKVGEPENIRRAIDVPPSAAALVPFSQTTSVLPLPSLKSNTISFTLRLAVQGVSKQPPAPAVETAIFVTVTEPGEPVTLLSLYKPRIPAGGIVPPEGDCRQCRLRRQNFQPIT